MSIVDRNHALRLAFLLHRVSGLGLVLFLPLHFWLLSFAVTDAARLDRFLTLAELPLVKVAEFGLVFLLAVHAFGGLRVMTFEHLSWPPHQKTFAALAVALAFLCAGIFLTQAV